MAPSHKKWKTAEKSEDNSWFSSCSIVKEKMNIKEKTIVKEQRNDHKELMNITCYDYNNMGPLFGLLPMEMLRMILLYLDAPSLACLGGTCKILYSYCDEMWKPLCTRFNLNVVDVKPTVLCVARPMSSDSIYSYENAVELCKKKKYKILAIRNWLFSRWSCVVCYNSSGSHHIDTHVDVTLCESCYSLFYRRKCHAKEEFSLTDKDLRMIDSEIYEFLVSDLITLARLKYGGKEGLKKRLENRKRKKEKREADKQCALIARESEVVAALYKLGSSYNDVSMVEPRCMPYVGSPPALPSVLQQSAEDAADWLISCKNRQKTRMKAMADEIRIRSGRCKGCQTRVDFHLAPLDFKCPHVSATMAEIKMRSIYEKFGKDIEHYSRKGLLCLEPGQHDVVQRSATELMNRHDRICDLEEELEFRKSSWPDIFHGRKIKDPMLSHFAQDFIYKGVVYLENKARASKFHLRDAEGVARVIIAFANGWDFRKKEITKALLEKGVSAKTLLRPQSQMLVDDFIDNAVVVQGGHIVACSASEIAERVSWIEGFVREGEPSPDVAQRCARISAECNPKPDFKQLQQERKQNLLSCLNIASFEELGSSTDPCQQPVADFINCGTATSLFGYKINTASSVAALIRLKQQLSMNEGKCNLKNRAYPRQSVIVHTRSLTHYNGI